MRRSKWDTPSPLTATVSSVSNKIISPAASSADIEMVKALAKKRLEELMVKKLNTCSVASTASITSTVSTGSTTSFSPCTASTSITSTTGAATTTAFQSVSSDTTQTVISDSVQKAAAIAAALHNGGMLPNQCQISSTMTPFYQVYGGNMRMHYSQQYSAFSSMPAAQTSSSQTFSENSSSAEMSNSAACFNSVNYSLGAYTLPYPPGVQNSIAYGSPFGSGNMYDRMANGIMSKMRSENYTAVPPPFMQRAASANAWNAAIIGPYGSNSDISMNAQPTSSDAYSPYLMYNKVANTNTSTLTKNKDSEEQNNNENGKYESLGKLESSETNSGGLMSGEQGESEQVISQMKRIFDVTFEEEPEVQFNHEIEQSLNGLYTTDIDINFSKARVRLGRKEALQVIRLRTGAAVISRGKLKEEISNNEKGLHVRITADTEDKVKNAVLIIKKLMVENVEKVKLRPEISADVSFDCVSLLKGESDKNLEYIMKISKAFVEVRGIGSKHPEDANRTENDLLHIAVYGLTESSRFKGLAMAQKLVDFVTKEWEEKYRRLTSPVQGMPQNSQQLYTSSPIPQQRMIMASPPDLYSSYSNSASPLSLYNYMSKNTFQNVSLYNSNVNLPINMIGNSCNNIVQSPPPPPLNMMNSASIPYIPGSSARSLQAVSTQPIPPAVASPAPYGLSWQDLLTDEKEQARRRKEMEEKRKQREKERKERKGKKRRVRSRSKSRSRSRSKSPEEKESVKVTKSFNFVPPPIELYTSAVASTNSVENHSNINKILDDNYIIGDDNIINEKYDSSSPIKESPPSSLKNKAFPPVKITDISNQDKDREIMPPPPPINFIKKKNCIAPSTISVTPVEEGVSNNGLSLCVSEKNKIEESKITSSEDSSFQPVSLVAYEDDSEEEFL